MKSLSIETAYQAAQQFVLREWRLLLPVILAFVALPGLILQLPVLHEAAVKMTTEVQSHGVLAAAPFLRLFAPVMLLIWVLGALGGLAVTAMALVPEISVREAIILAARRLPVYLGSILLVFLAGLVLASLLSLLLAMTMRGNIKAAQGLASLIVSGAGLVIGVRVLFLLMPMIVHRRIGSVSALRETWILTQRAFWRLLAITAIYIAGSMVVMLAFSAGVGSLLLMLGRAVGAVDLADAVNSVLQQGVTALFALGLHVIAAAVFAQLDGSSRGM